ncbi:MAG: hypothetical protein ACJAWW_002343 [Sulfurimonas sp.]|jgi:hypothetical protein
MTETYSSVESMNSLIMVAEAMIIASSIVLGIIYAPWKG